MGMTNFPNGVASYGIPIPGNIPFGPDSRLVFVDQLRGSDGHDGKTPKKAVATLSKAHSLMTANRNDVAIVIGSTTGTNPNASGGSSIAVRESATLAWSKDQCHIIGISANRIAQRVSIRSDGTEFTPLVNVTADGCVFANVHAYHGYDDDSAQICWNEAGERNAYFNVHFGGMGHQTAADNAGGRSLKLNGDGERYFRDCTIGIDTVDRGAANAQIEFASAAVRDVFENCRIISRADSASALLVTIGSGGLDRFVEFKDCLFHNHGTGLTQAMSVDNSAGGSVILRGSMLVGATEWDANDNAYTNFPAAAATGGVGATVAGA